MDTQNTSPSLLWSDHPDFGAAQRQVDAEDRAKLLAKIEEIQENKRDNRIDYEQKWNDKDALDKRRLIAFERSPEGKKCIEQNPEAIKKGRDIKDIWNETHGAKTIVEPQADGSVITTSRPQAQSYNELTDALLASGEVKTYQSDKPEAKTYTQAQVDASAQKFFDAQTNDLAETMGELGKEPRPIEHWKELCERNFIRKGFVLARDTSGLNK